MNLCSPENLIEILHEKEIRFDSVRFLSLLYNKNADVVINYIFENISIHSKELIVYALDVCDYELFNSNLDSILLFFNSFNLI